MTIKWTDVLEISENLCDMNPNIDPLSINFVKLRELVLNIKDFNDDPNKCNERILEAIQQAWIDERV